MTDQRTCWEICRTIERSLREFGTDDNCPMPEMALEERAVLQRLEAMIRDSKTQLALYSWLRDEHDGRIPVEVWS